MGRLVNQKLLPMRDKSTALRPPTFAPLCGQPTVVRRLSSVLCRLSSVLCPPSLCHPTFAPLALLCGQSSAVRRQSSDIRPPFSVYCPLSTVLCRLSSVLRLSAIRLLRLLRFFAANPPSVRPPPSVLRPPSSVVCPPPSAVRLLRLFAANPPSVRPPSSVLRRLSSALRRPTFAPLALLCGQSSAVRRQSSVLRPPSTVHCLPSSVSPPSDFCAFCASLRPILRRPPSVIRHPSSVYPARPAQPPSSSVSALRDLCDTIRGSKLAPISEN
jgi:hypothetical protein